MKLFALLAAWAIYTFAGAQTIATKADQLLQAYTTQHKFSGTVLIAVRDSVVFHKAYGSASIKANQPNTINTTFRAGSLTKMFTSALIAQLAAEKKLSFDDTLSKYLPQANWCKGVTIRQLLSHTSGIRGNTPPGALTPAAMVGGFQSAAPAFAPGEKFEYNNFNFIILSYIAEQVTGTPYPVLLKKAVLDKAGMSRSGIDSANRVDRNKATGYTINPMTGEWVATGGGEAIKAASGAGALFTSTGDLYKWSRAIYNPAVWPGTSFQQATTPVKEDYGLGWIVRQRNGHLQVGHTGAIEGFISDMLLFPKDGVTIIYLSNLQDINTAAFEKNLIALALGEPYEMPKEMPEIKLSVKEMQEYVGTYGQDSQGRMVVQIEGEKLILTAPGGDKMPLSVASKDHFFLKGPDIEVIFNRKENTLTTMLVKMGPGMLFEKVNP